MLRTLLVEVAEPYAIPSQITHDQIAARKSEGWAHFPAEQQIGLLTAQQVLTAANPSLPQTFVGRMLGDRR